MVYFSTSGEKNEKKFGNPVPEKYALAKADESLS
jgi:hypothetical protein